MATVTAPGPRPSTPVLPSDAGYDAARTAWELSTDQRPAAVSLPETAQDVIAAVAFARERGLRITAQGSGHNPNPLGDLSDTVLVKTGVRAPLLSAELRQLGGALGRAPADGGAVASLAGRYLLFGAGMTPTRDSQVATRAQLEAMRATFAPWASPQTYINFAETSRPAAGLWGPEVLSRLQRIKATVDPDEIIRSNHPIRPERPMTNPNDDVVAEFRGNSGTVTQAMDGNLAHLQLLLLHHIGRRSGQVHIAPVSYMAYHDDYLLLGSFAGAPTEPQWVANVENATEVTVEMGTRTRTMTPTVLRAGPQRDSLYEAAREHWPFVLDYEKQTSRPFPVIQLVPID